MKKTTLFSYLFPAAHLLLVAALAIPSAQAGQEKGGGIGIISGGDIFLADFVEAGLEESVAIPTSASNNYKTRLNEFRQRIGRAIPFLTNDEADAAAYKLIQVGTKDWILANALLVKMEQYLWRQVNFDLVNPEDYSLAIKTLKKNEIVLALRLNQMIRVHKTHWAKLKLSHKVGLVFHEIIYALQGSRASDQSRSLIGMIFDPSFESGVWIPSFVKAQLPYSLPRFELNQPYPLYSRQVPSRGGWGTWGPSSCLINPSESDSCLPSPSGSFVMTTHNEVRFNPGIAVAIKKNTVNKAQFVLAYQGAVYPAIPVNNICRSLVSFPAHEIQGEGPSGIPVTLAYAYESYSILELGGFEFKQAPFKSELAEEIQAKDLIPVDSTNPFEDCKAKLLPKVMQYLNSQYFSRYR